MNTLSPHLPTSDVSMMVDFYKRIGFSLAAEPFVKDGTPVFALLALGDTRLRIEYWNFPNWEAYKEGFSITTLWIDTDSVDQVTKTLESAGISFEGPSLENYGSKEIELFDPEGFRIIFAETQK